jgi:hypothetical protein
MLIAFFRMCKIIPYANSLYILLFSTELTGQMGAAAAVNIYLVAVFW